MTSDASDRERDLDELMANHLEYVALVAENEELTRNLSALNFATVNDYASQGSETSGISGASGSQSDDTGRYCWVCFATEEDDPTAHWVKPCNCRGTTKWVHQACVQRWVDEKQKGERQMRVTCPQCQTEYLIVYPNMGVIVTFLDSIDTITHRMCPFMAGGVVVLSVYWTAFSYGAITLMQTIGPNEGLAIIEKTKPLVLLIGLPAIPVALIAGKLIRWEDTILNFIRRRLVHVPLVKYLLPFQIDVTRNQTIQHESLPALDDPVSATRLICGALLFPTIAVFVGRMFFDSVRSNFRRTLLGGMTFILAKGFLKIYHKQQQYVRQCKREILDHTPANIALVARQNLNIHNLDNNNRRVIIDYEL